MKYSQAEIQPFLDACDAMINSKFILVDKRIGDVLKSIATTKPVYNTIAEAMINFNWSAEFKRSTNKTGELVVPEEGLKLIAFVFCLLKNIDAGKVNINDLLVKHCSNDEDKRSSYVVFCEKTIKPFKQILLNKLCQVAEQPKEQVVIKPTINIKVHERLEFLVKDVKMYVMGLKKIKGSILSKTEYIELVDMLLLALKNKDYQYYDVFARQILKMSGKDGELINRLSAIIELLAHLGD